MSTSRNSYRHDSFRETRGHPVCVVCRMNTPNINEFKGKPLFESGVYHERPKIRMIKI